MFMIHSTLLLVSLQTYFVFESPPELSLMNDEAVQHMLPLGDLSRGI